MLRFFAAAFFFARGLDVFAGAASSFGAGVSCLIIGGLAELSFTALTALGFRLVRAGAAATGATAGVATDGVALTAGVAAGAGVGGEAVTVACASFAVTPASCVELRFCALRFLF